MYKNKNVIPFICREISLTLIHTLTHRSEKKVNYKSVLFRASKKKKTKMTTI